MKQRAKQERCCCKRGNVSHNLHLIQTCWWRNSWMLQVHHGLVHQGKCCPIFSQSQHLLAAQQNPIQEAYAWDEMLINKNRQSMCYRSIKITPFMHFATQQWNQFPYSSITWVGKASYIWSVWSNLHNLNLILIMYLLKDF